MDIPGTHIEETAGDFFAELETAAAMAKADIGRAYATVGAVFRRAADQRLLHSGIAFAGMFAKVDHLLRECGVRPPLTYYINDTRVRLRRLNDLSDAARRRHFAHDLKNVCRFVSVVCGGAPVPASLAALLPRTDPAPEHGAALAECMRVAVAAVSGTTVTATTTHGATVSVDCSGPWAALCPLLEAGAQLNLVRPREEGGALVPEIVILEPDYLVDISAIAACFETCGASPYTYLLNKLKPAPRSVHILLGNLSGQLLDDVVHGSRRGYAGCVADFFRHNALAVASTDGVDASLHAEGASQLDNIRRAITEVLPAEVGGYRPEQTVLEPSFFSETLGLQGRMDFLQTDPDRPGRCVLIEQKSGKGAFPPGPDPDTPRQQEKHYVQLLLYMALLRYDHHRQGADVSAFLLYSHYRNSLLRVGPAPELLHSALMLRNKIVWCEMWYARGGISVLEKLTPERLNTRHAAGRLWEQYTRPQIEALLRPVRQASALERAYYYRFMTFLEREHLLAKLGNKTKENSGFAAKWLDTLEEKLQAGNILCPLAVESLAPGEERAAGVGRVTLAFADSRAAEGSNFRPGDIVVLYSYRRGQEPDVRRTVALRATVVAMTTAALELSLRNPQTDSRVFSRPKDCCWAVEHDMFESSFGSLYRAMHSFLSAPQRRRDLLLGLRRPESAPEYALRGDYGAFNPLVSRAMRARDFFLVIGPPGTGKTSFAMLNILKEELLAPGSAVLLMAYTNRAVDEMCSKLADSGIGFVRLGSRLACAEAYRDSLLEQRAASCANVDGVRRLIAGARVFCATTSAMNSNPALLAMKRFSLAIIDEASQILEPHLAGLLGATADGAESIGRFVLIGDHKQLPAVVQQTPEESAVDDPQLRAIGLADCRDSLFERLLRANRGDDSVVWMLTRQGRMHRDIADFPSRAFYGGRLRPVPLEHQERPLPPHAPCADAASGAAADCRVAFIDVCPDGQDASDKVNTAEARVIAKVAAEVRWRHAGRFDPARSLGVIVPYRNQIAAVREAMAATGADGLDRIDVDTVERYQGSQRDTIIYGFTVRKRYQLNFLTSNVFVEDGELIDRKLNVAMTRAREHLVMVGDTRLLAQNEVFARLIETVRSGGGYYEDGRRQAHRPQTPQERAAAPACIGNKLM